MSFIKALWHHVVPFESFPTLLINEDSIEIVIQQKHFNTYS